MTNPIKIISRREADRLLAEGVRSTFVRDEDRTMTQHLLHDGRLLITDATREYNAIYPSERAYLEFFEWFDRQDFDMMPTRITAGVYSDLGKVQSDASSSGQRLGLLMPSRQRLAFDREGLLALESWLKEGFPFEGMYERDSPYDVVALFVGEYLRVLGAGKWALRRSGGEARAEVVVATGSYDPWFIVERILDSERIEVVDEVVGLLSR